MDAHSRSSFVQLRGCLNRTVAAWFGSKPSAFFFWESTRSLGSLWKRFMSFQMDRSWRVSWSKVTRSMRSSSPRP